MDTHALALIAVHPQSLRYSLQALLTTIPSLKSVNSVADAQSVAAVAAVLHPALAILDTALLGDEIERVVEQIKTVSPRTRCIVLVDSIQQQRGLTTTHADAVLLKGFPAAELLVVVKRVLDQSGETMGRNVR